MSPLASSLHSRQRPVLALFLAVPVLCSYAAGAEPVSPLRAGISRAADALITNDRTPLPGHFAAPATDAVSRFGDEIIALQQDVGLAEYRLRAVLEDLDRLKGGPYREETARWQATYDFTCARLQQRIAYLASYNLALGQFRKNLLSEPRPPAGWHLVAQKGLPDDRDAQLVARAARVRLEALASRHKGTPWELLARRELLAPVKLEWQSAEK